MGERPLQLQAGPGMFTLNWPIGITILRLLLLPLFLWIILSGAGGLGQALPGDRRVRWLAVGVFLVMALTDKLDGYLARRLNQTTRLGAILDPLADKLLIACALVLLSFPWIVPAPYAVPPWVILGVYGKDCAVAIGAMILLGVTGRVEIVARLLGKVSTVLQLVLVLMTLLAVDLQAISPRMVVVLLRVMWALVILVAAAASADYTMAGSRQYASFRRRNLGGAISKPAV